MVTHQPSKAPFPAAILFSGLNHTWPRRRARKLPQHGIEQWPRATSGIWSGFFPPVEVLKESDEQLVGGFNFQPISKILVKIGSFPQVGLKIKSVGNHSLDKVLISCYSHSRVRNPFRHQTSGMLPHSRVKIRQLSQASFPPLCPETQDIQHHFG